MDLIVDINISWFCVSLNLSSPYRKGNGNIFHATHKDGSDWIIEVAAHEIVCCVFSFNWLQLQQSGFNVSLKPCLNLCSRRWLKSNLSLHTRWVINIVDFLSTGLMNSNNALRKMLQLLELQMFRSSSWRRLLSYRNHSIDLQSKSMDWFLYNKGLRHERVNDTWKKRVFEVFSSTRKYMGSVGVSVRISHLWE